MKATPTTVDRTRAAFRSMLQSHTLERWNAGILEHTKRQPIETFVYHPFEAPLKQSIVLPSPLKADFISTWDFNPAPTPRLTQLPDQMYTLHHSLALCGASIEYLYQFATPVPPGVSNRQHNLVEDAPFLTFSHG